MSRIRAAIIKYIDDYEAESGLTDDGLGRRAAGDNKLILRLRRGENVGMAGIEKVEEYIIQQKRAAKAGKVPTVST